MKRHACLLAALLCLSCGDTAPRPQSTPAADDSMTLAAFFAQRPEKAAVRASCRIDGHLDKGTFRVSLVSADGDPWASGEALADRKTDTGARLFEALQDGARHGLTLEVRPADGFRVEILRVIR